MAEKTEEELRDQYEEIRDETLISANTATRVGQAMLDGLDSYQLKADLPSGLPDGGLEGQFLQRQFVSLPLRFPRIVTTTDGNNWIVGNSPMDFSGWDPTFQDSTGIAQGTIDSSIFENNNFQAPNDTTYVTNFVVHEPISGKTFAIMTTLVFNDSYIAEVTSFNPPTLGPVNALRNAGGSTTSDPSAFTVNGGYIWVTASGGGYTLKLDPNSATFWEAIADTSSAPSPIRGLYYDTNVAKYGDGFPRLWNLAKSNGWTRYSEQNLDAFEFVSQPPTGNWTSNYGGFSVDDANGRIYSIARSNIDGNFHLLRFDMEPEFTNQVSVEVAANNSLDPMDCIWDPTTNKVIGYFADQSDIGPFGQRGKLYIATDNGGSFSSVTEILLPEEVGTPGNGNWAWQPKLSIVGNQLFIPVNGAFNSYTPSKPQGYILRMDLATNAVTLMTRTSTAGWTSITGGDLESVSNTVRVRGLTDAGGSSYPIIGTFSTGINSGFLRFNGSTFQTATVDVPPEPFNIIETTSDMTSYFGSPVSGRYIISNVAEAGIYYVKGFLDLGSNGIDISTRVTFLSGSSIGGNFTQSTLGGFSSSRAFGSAIFNIATNLGVEFRTMVLRGGNDNLPLVRCSGPEDAAGTNFNGVHMLGGSYRFLIENNGFGSSYRTSTFFRDCEFWCSEDGFGRINGNVKCILMGNRIHPWRNATLEISTGIGDDTNGGAIICVHNNHWLTPDFNYSYSPIQFLGGSNTFVKNLSVANNTFELPDLDGSFGSGPDIDVIQFSGPEADRVLSGRFINNFAYVSDAASINMFGFSGGSANQIRRGVFIGNTIISDGTPTMFDIAHIRSDWICRANTVNDSFIQESALAP